MGTRTLAALLYIALALSVLTYCTALTQEKHRLEAEKVNEGYAGSAQSSRTDYPEASP